jgi:O-acetyl-ADP-ribose deacetylase (regulator of RNase III)
MVKTSRHTTAGPAVEIVQGDITRIEADAIVNAANAQLAAGGGVCGAIFRAAGTSELTAACRKIGHCPTGTAAITPAFAINTARYIIHAVGPVYANHAPDEAATLLAAAYRSALNLAAAHGCTSIAFPAISTGIFGYLRAAACEIAAKVCCETAASNGLHVMLVAFDDLTATTLRQALEAQAAASRKN